MSNAILEADHYVERRDPDTNQIVNIAVVIEHLPELDAYRVLDADGRLQIWPLPETHSREN